MLAAASSDNITSPAFGSCDRSLDDPEVEHVAQSARRHGRRHVGIELVVGEHGRRRQTDHRSGTVVGELVDGVESEPGWSGVDDVIGHEALIALGT